MIRVVTALVAAVLCHPSTSWSQELPPEKIADGLLMYSIDVVRNAQKVGALRTCPTERCLARKPLKMMGKTALVALGVATLKRFVTPAYIRASIASYATKSLAKYGLAAVGIGGVYAAVVLYAAYESVVTAIQPADSIELADSILFNDALRAKFLKMPRQQIFLIASHDALIAHELVMMAHAVLVARETPSRGTT